MMEIFNKLHKNKEEFTENYNLCFEYVYSFVYARTAGDIKVTEEIVQEAFTAAWMSYERFSHKSAFRTWVCGIAKNKLHEYYRKKIFKEKHGVNDAQVMEDVSSNFNLEEIVLRCEESRGVIAALNNVNHLYRYTLILKYIDDCSVKEIARILGRTPKAVDGMLQRAKSSFIREYVQISGKGNENG